MIPEKSPQSPLIPSLITILGVLLCACLWPLLGDSENRAAAAFLGIKQHSLATLIYLSALLLIALYPKQSQTSNALSVILLGAVGARLILLFQDPSLSDDVFRYVWEGKVQKLGLNPFTTAPNDPRLLAHRDAIWQGVNHKDIPAIYPPVMQWLFYLTSLFSEHLRSIKALFLIFDLALVATLVKALKDQGMNPSWVILYAWHPLVIMEVAGQGHFEPIPALFLLLCALALAKQRHDLASLSLWTSIGAKYLPAAFLPLALQQAWRGPEPLEAQTPSAPKPQPRWLRLAKHALGPLLLLILFWPYLEDGWNQALGKYGKTWRFNDSGFFLIDASLKKLGLSAWFCRNLLPWVVDPKGMDLGLHQSYLLLPAKLCVGALLMVILSALIATKTDFIDACLIFFSAFFALSPVLHPWYLIWLLALLPLRPHAPILLWTLLIPLSYEILLRYDGRPETWTESPWVKVAVAAPPLLLLLSQCLTRRLSSQEKPPNCDSL